MSNIKSINEITVELHGFQQELIAQTRATMKNIIVNEKNGVEDKRSIMVQSPCGSGKSVVIAEIINGAVRKGGKVLFIAHSLILVNQMQERLDAIGIDRSLVDIGTNLTFGNKRHLAKDDLPEYTMIIVDEAHRSSASTYQNIFDKWPNAWRIGFTATPWRMKGKPLSAIYKHLILGPSVRWLIDHDYLADYQIVSEAIVTEEMRNSLSITNTGEFKQTDVDSMFDLIDSKTYRKVVKAYQTLMADKKTIIYVSNIKIANEIQMLFEKEGVNANVLHSDIKPDSEKDKILNDFRSGQTRILITVNMANEGVDIPDCEAVILLRPTASLSIHIQQAMRCMRICGGKKAIIVDMVNNIPALGEPGEDLNWAAHFNGENLKEKEAKVSNEVPVVRKPKEIKINTKTYCPHNMAFANVLALARKKGWKNSAIVFKCREYGVKLTNKELYFLCNLCGYKQGWLLMQPEFQRQQTVKSYSRK